MGGRQASWWAPGREPSPGTSPLFSPHPPTGSASDAVPLQRSQSLSHAATVALGGTPEPSTLSSSALSEREASRLDKFKHLLAGPNTDLGESWGRVPRASPRGESL